MKKWIAAALMLNFGLFGVAFAESAKQEGQACKQPIEMSCTGCHGMKKICATLEKPDADWKMIVADMGKRGNLSQEAQDTAHSCLTKEQAKSELCAQ